MPTTADLYRIRRVNLRALIREWGGSGTLAKRLGHASGSFLSQMAGPVPTREVSEKTARKIEKQLSLPDGWLDKPAVADNPSNVDTTKVTEIVRLVATTAESEKIKLTPQQLGDIVDLAYEFSGSARDQQAMILRLLKLTK